MKEILLIKNGELALKGLNRFTFEDALVKNLRRRLRDLGECEIRKSQSAIFVEPRGDSFDFETALARVSKVFGVAGFSRACVCEKTMESILSSCAPYLRDTLAQAHTFKVEAKRADKRFPLTSPQISAEVGAALLDAYPHLRVDVHEPEVTVVVEVRDYAAYVRAGQIPGAGGMPAGTAGRACVLVSGGIDSPVAAWMMAKRGVDLFAVHFASPPYTSMRAEQKVMSLLERVAEYGGRIKTAVVPFTEIQEQISDRCPEALSTLIMRRFMMRIAERLARQEECQALITGESLGQVASQTLGALAVTDAVCGLPVFRPLVGMDKEEIIRTARKIDTFELSVLPYDDCCTVFTPKHPRTKPRAGDVEAAERLLDAEALIRTAAEAAAVRWIG